MAKYIRAVEAAEKVAGKVPMADLVEIFAEITAADVAPVRHGRWENRQGGFWGVATCSVCGEKFPTGEIGLNYCPNCGAKMDGEDGDA